MRGFEQTRASMEVNIAQDHNDRDHDNSTALPPLGMDDVSQHGTNDEITSNSQIDPERAGSDEKSSSGSDHVGGGDEKMQRGVRQMAAITQVWSRTSLIIVYATMFSIYLVNAFQNSITGNLSAYITSEFSEHSLIPVIGIVSSIMSAAAYMPVAKALNTWDRTYGFVCMVCFAVLGLVLSAACTNIAVYCAAQVFYSIGFVGLILSVDVITTDTSRLRDRGLAYAFTSFPYVISAFAGPKAAEGFYDTNWRWGYGLFAILLPVVAAPLLIVLVVNKRKAERAGLLVETEVAVERSVKGMVWYYAIEFDILGVFALAGGLALFLLPFSLAADAPKGWNSGYIIAMIVVGLLLLISFALIERYVSPVPFMPFELLTSRTVLGACLLSFTYQIAYYCWYDYFSSFLQVVYDITIAQAGYIQNTFDVVSGVWLIVVGYAIRRTGYFRWLLMWAVPLYMLGVGLMIYFRRPDQRLGYVIMCQIFIALGGGPIIICEQVAVLAAGSHNQAAAALAMLGVFGYIGGAVGGAISGAIWTHTLPDALAKYLPEESLPSLEDIYNDLEVQLSYPMGDATRSAIISAYGVAQSRMLIAGTAIMTLALGFVFLIKNIKVANNEQVKGVLF